MHESISCQLHKKAKLKVKCKRPRTISDGQIYTLQDTINKINKSLILINIVCFH